MTPCFEKRCFFDTGEKVGFINCVFEKLCFSENTILQCFQKTQQLHYKNSMLKNQKIQEN